MASNEETPKPEESEAPAGAELAVAEADAEALALDGATPSDLGIERYVHLAFFMSGVFVAYLVGKSLAGAWGLLAATPAAVRSAPWLLRLAEDERVEFTMVAGAIVGIVSVVVALRKPGVRKWADEVAAELYKVHWPDRETVTNGTIVVLAGGVFATIYVGLLDRLWNFVTNLVYGI
jgi:preprotein translocase SecE subunit